MAIAYAKQKWNIKLGFLSDQDEWQDMTSRRQAVSGQFVYLRSRLRVS